MTISMPLLLFDIPINDADSPTLFLERKPLIDYGKIMCPYDNANGRRIREGEFSHGPLSMEMGSRYDDVSYEKEVSRTKDYVRKLIIY